MENRTKYCKKCGTAYTIGEKFCGNCGEKFETTDGTIGIFSKHEDNKVVETAMPQKKNIFAIIKLVLLILISFMVLFFDTVISSQQGSPTTILNETLIQYILMTRGRMYPELIIELISSVTMIVSIIVLMVGLIMQLKNNTKTNVFRDILCCSLIFVGMICIYFSIGIFRFETDLMIMNLKTFLAGAKYGIIILPLSTIGLLVTSIVDAVKKN